MPWGRLLCPPRERVKVQTENTELVCGGQGSLSLCLVDTGARFLLQARRRFRIQTELVR